MVVVWRCLAVLLLSFTLTLYHAAIAYAPLPVYLPDKVTSHAVSVESREDYQELIATAYILEDGSGTGQTSTGTIPMPGKTIAVDPNVIPYNSIVYIEGLGEFVAEDTGGAIKGNRLDIYMGEGPEAYQEAINWGVRNVKGRVTN